MKTAPKLKVHVAKDQQEKERWKCNTCTAPAEEDSTYCVHCRLYWHDAANGLFGD